MTVDPIQVALLAAEALESCGLRYLIGGSLASSFSGEPRATLDIDMVVDLSPKLVAAVVERMKGEFYADADSLRRAAAEHSSANIIHLATSIKVDLFVMGGTPLDEQQMERRQQVQIPGVPGRFLYVYAPEDILLQKLRWYRLGGEKSDHQWRDVMGILRVQGERLDGAYLRRGAETLGVEDLLSRALTEGEAP
ncbi:MAG TPA: hypothetical protein VNI57_11045 [Candidatus Saccharimonadales bacterium]|nr:hypothetical protein [Candidatus Saccharimonadales bacterium]